MVDDKEFEDQVVEKAVKTELTKRAAPVWWQHES